MVSSAAVLWHVERISHIPEDTFSTIIPLTWSRLQPIKNQPVRIVLLVCNQVSPGNNWTLVLSSCHWAETLLNTCEVFKSQWSVSQQSKIPPTTVLTQMDSNLNKKLFVNSYYYSLLKYIEIFYIQSNIIHVY
jgi:hypothetical protein